VGYLDYRFFVTDVAWIVGWGFILGIGLVVVVFALGVLAILVALALLFGVLLLAYVAAYAVVGSPVLAGIAITPAATYLGGFVLSSMLTFFSDEGFQPFWQESFDWRWIHLSLALAGGFGLLRLVKRGLLGSADPYYV
jgi:hypothetical protein